MPRPTEKPDPASFGGRLKKARDERGMTQGELATKAGLKQSDISKLEKGLMRSTTKGFGLSKALRVSQEWLELGEGPEPLWRTTAEADAPAPPPAKYKDRNTVTDSQLALLRAIELVLPPGEQQRILDEAERIRRVSEEQIESAKRFAGSVSGTMIQRAPRPSQKEGANE